MGWNREKDRRAGRNVSIAASVFGLIFAIFWCVTAAAMDAGFMLIFGIPFAAFMGCRLVLCLRLAGKKDRPEPWEQPDRPQQTPRQPSAASRAFCPYCGEALQDTFAFCPRCGRRLS